MKRRNIRKETNDKKETLGWRNPKKVTALVLAVTLAVSSWAPITNVQAAESEQETEEDKQYIVYIDLPDDSEKAADAGLEQSTDLREAEAQTDADTKDDKSADGGLTADDGREGEKAAETEAQTTDKAERSSVSDNTVDDTEQDAEDEQETVQEEEDHTYADGSAETTDDRGEGEVVWEEIREAELLMDESADSAELTKNDSAIVYEADLTQKEIKELAQSGAEIYVEENIELWGAGSRSKAALKSGKPETKRQEKQKKQTTGQEQGTDGKTNSNNRLPEEDVQKTEWNISMIHGDAGSKPDGEPVKVAIMDSGIELLSGIPVEGMVNLVKSEQDVPYYINDMAGHGTAVASIVSDIAEDAQIYCVKIMDEDNRATLGSVIEGIYWCIDHDIDIINMSFGTKVQSQALHKAIQDAADAGILIVSSAGNGNLAGVEYPAAFEEVLAVGAVDTSAQKTQESAVGEEVELAAPGEQILATSMLGLETVVSGTSMAAPHVTGAAAVLWQKDKTKSADFIRGLLKESANDLGDENAYGSGLIDLQFALEHYDQYATAYEERQDTVAETQTDVQLLSEENRAPIETHEEVDYVEGRWKANEHRELISKGSKSAGLALEEDEIEIFKLGMVAPDKYFKVKDSKDNRVWHGGYIFNYIANYKFATNMAQAKGNPSKFGTVKGQSASNRSWMTYCINDKSIRDTENNRWITYDEILKSHNYSSQNKTVQGNWRRIYLYGMATHIMSDTFSHRHTLNKELVM
ncbi:MAG: S8 family serine peptidase [Lachnospiraceae bacterium]|nr:S8 family serine peptidase [Lachnospiraceae bacterium]